MLLFATHLWIEVGGIQVDVVYPLTSYGRMHDMVWRSAEVAAVQIPKYLLRSDERRLVCAIPSVDRLCAFEQK